MNGCKKSLKNIYKAGHAGRKGLIAWLIIFISTGVGHAKSDEDVEPVDMTLYFKSFKCVEPIEVLFEEWIDNGGGFNTSLRAIREQIKKDKKSRFARLVKQIWKIQDQNGFIETKKPLGHWPLTTNAEAQISMAFRGVDKSEYFPEHCQKYWFGDIINNSFQRKIVNNEIIWSEPLEEYPQSLDWQNRQSAHWLIHWIFINWKNIEVE